MKKLALFSAVITVTGLVLKLCEVQVGETLLITGMSSLALVSFMLGWIFPCPYSVEDEGYVGGMCPIWNFAMMMTGFSLAVGLEGLLFRLLHWPGGVKMLLLGGGSLVVCGIAWLYFLYFKKKSNKQSKQ